MKNGMIMKTAKECIDFIIKDKGRSSFVDIERIMEKNGIDPENGESNYLLPFDDEHENVFIWTFRSEEAIEVWQAMVDIVQNEEKGIAASGTEFMTYFVDGVGLIFPFAKSLRSYKEPHWLPVVLSVENLPK